MAPKYFALSTIFTLVLSAKKIFGLELIAIISHLALLRDMLYFIHSASISFRISCMCFGFLDTTSVSSA